MLRRSHKKSRAGCKECHRRHIKCDENWPRCTNCTVVERSCSGPSKRTSSRAVSSNSTPTASSDDTAVPKLTARPIDPGEDKQTGDLGEPLNMSHMELIVHYSISVFVPEIDEKVNDLGTKAVLRAGVDAAYLLYESLAISARHLAIVNPAKSDLYLRQAVQLQTRAIRLFNSGDLQITESNCIAMVLFSSTLGRHMLIDTLANRSDDIDDFLESYFHYVEVHRGLKAVSLDTRPLLLETELRPLMEWGEELTMMSSRGEETSELKDIISRSTRLSAGSKDACLSAIHYLQVGFDEFSKSDPGASRYFMVFNWSVMGPPEYTDLLRRRQPEALLILGYYGVLLYYARDIWQIRDSGAYLVTSISKYLGPEWIQWMSWPLGVIKPQVHTETRRD